MPINDKDRKAIQDAAKAARRYAKNSPAQLRELQKLQQALSGADEATRNFCKAEEALFDNMSKQILDMPDPASAFLKSSNRLDDTNSDEVDALMEEMGDFVRLEQAYGNKPKTGYSQGRFEPLDPDDEANIIVQQAFDMARLEKKYGSIPVTTSLHDSNVPSIDLSPTTETYDQLEEYFDQMIEATSNLQNQTINLLERGDNDPEFGDHTLDELSADELAELEEAFEKLDIEERAGQPSMATNTDKLTSASTIVPILTERAQSIPVPSTSEDLNVTPPLTKPAKDNLITRILKNISNFLSSAMSWFTTRKQEVQQAKENKTKQSPPERKQALINSAAELEKMAKQFDNLGNLEQKHAKTCTNKAKNPKLNNNIRKQYFKQARAHNRKASALFKNAQALRGKAESIYKTTSSVRSSTTVEQNTEQSSSYRGPKP